MRLDVPKVCIVDLRVCLYADTIGNRFEVQKLLRLYRQFSGEISRSCNPGRSLANSMID